MPAIFFALISYIGWGAGDIFGAIATKKIGGYSLTFWSCIFWLLMPIPFIPFFIHELNNASLGIIAFLLSLNALTLVGLVSFYEGLRKGPVSLVITISASFAALVVIFSTLFLGERLSISQIISIVAIIAGVILSSLNFKEIREKKLRLTTGIFLALIAMVLWGITYTFIKIPIREIGWFWSNYFFALLFPLVFLYMRFRKIKLNLINTRNTFLSTLFNAVFIDLGGFSFNYAISKGLVSIVAPIAGSYPTLSVLLAFIFFKDRITKQQILGIVTTLIGIVLLSFFSV